MWTPPSILDYNRLHHPVKGAHVRHSLTVNGADRHAYADADAPLLHVLRNELGLVGTRFGCGAGACGACLVWLDGQPTASCGVHLGDVGGRTVDTVEGLAGPEGPHPLQQAFEEEQAGQCGYCLSGILMAAAALLRDHPAPTRDQVVGALDGNLCRCGAHGRIIAAILRAAAATTVHESASEQ